MNFQVSEESECKCSPNDTNPCGPENRCINYETAFECNEDCPARDRCQNKRFTKRIYPKVQLKKFDRKGWGLVALEHIPRTSFIIEYVGDVINNAEFNRRFEQSVETNAQHFYFMRLKTDLYIDSSVRGNESRFINHSCEPNCTPHKWTINGQTRIGFFADVDIPLVGPIFIR